VDRQDCAGIDYPGLQSHFHGALSILIKLCRDSHNEEIEAKRLASNDIAMALDGYIDEMFGILDMAFALERMTPELPRCMEGHYHLHPLLAEQVAKALACLEAGQGNEGGVPKAA
jgi:hypothetical protein